MSSIRSLVRDWRTLAVRAPRLVPVVVAIILLSALGAVEAVAAPDPTVKCEPSPPAS